jgi:signal peptidase
VWYSIPYLGRLNSMISGRQHRALLFGVAAVPAAYAVWMFVRSHRDEARRKQQS